MANKKLTIEDRDCYYLMPDGWFTPSRLPYPRVQRAEYRCNRLKELGLLESRVIGETLTNLPTEYRKLPQQQ